MKNLIYAVLGCAALLTSLPCAAENRAVNLNFVGEGKGIDLVALRATRKIIGTAVADGVVDAFNITPLKTNTLTPKNTGYTACLEVGIGAPPMSFDALVKRLKFIHPKRGTVITVELAESCRKPEVKPEIIACGGITAKLCPDNLICVDDPRDTCDPAQGGKDCAGVCNIK